MKSEEVSDIIIDENNRIIFADDPTLIGIVIDTEQSIPVLEVDALSDGVDENNIVSIDIPKLIPRLKRWKI